MTAKGNFNMKKIILFIPFLMLMGCSTVEHEFSSSQEKMAVSSKKGLVGRSAGDILDELGQPRTILTEAPHQVWTYRNNECVTLVYFDEKNEVCFAEERGKCMGQFIF